MEKVSCLRLNCSYKHIRLYEVNVFSVITLAQASLPYLRKSDRGSIVIVSSGAAAKGYRGWGAYGS